MRLLHSASLRLAATASPVASVATQGETTEGNRSLTGLWSISHRGYQPLAAATAGGPRNLSAILAERDVVGVAPRHEVEQEPARADAVSAQSKCLACDAQRSRRHHTFQFDKTVSVLRNKING